MATGPKPTPASHSGMVAWSHANLWKRRKVLDQATRPVQTALHARKPRYSPTHAYHTTSIMPLMLNQREEMVHPTKSRDQVSNQSKEIGGDAAMGDGDVHTYIDRGGGGGTTSIQYSTWYLGGRVVHHDTLSIHPRGYV